MSFDTSGNIAETVATPNAGVAFVRNDLAKQFTSYDLIGVCLGGSEAVKTEGTKYLPMPDPGNTTPDNLARYSAYKQRAVFYNVTQRTALGLQGQIFLRDPVIKYPAALESVVTDSNGSGISLVQLSRDATWYTLANGRSGLFVDYPPVTEPATKAQLASGNIRPTITVYGPKAVINWRTKVVGSKSILCLVVLKEEYTVDDDGFETKHGIQYRELRLGADGRYFVQLWRAPDPKGNNFEKFGEAYYPKDGKGKFLDAIPFTFIGSKNNEPSIDPAPLLDLANINIAHYCNSADYEEMIYVVGQPMLVVAGLDEDWYNKVMGGKVPFGSRSGLALPKDATAQLLQVEPNTAAKEGMEQKERQMVALGAKVVEQKQVQRTATEAKGEEAAEQSTLVAIAKNVSAAMKWALEWAAVFANVAEGGIEFELNTDFELSRMTSDEIAAVIKAWQDEALSWSEMRSALRKAGRATQDDDEAKAEIETDAAAAIERAARQLGAETDALNGNRREDDPPGNVGSGGGDE